MQKEHISETHTSIDKLHKEIFRFVAGNDGNLLRSWNRVFDSFSSLNL